MPQVLPIPLFRLKFDVPHSFAIEPGYVRATHCHDFKEQKDTFSGTWRDPMTGVLLLRPSFISHKITDATYWKPLTQWTYDTAFWEQVFDGVDPVINDGVSRFWASKTAYSGTDYGDFSANSVHTAVSVAVAVASIAGVIDSDLLYWAHESTFEIAPDEGFVWYYRAIAKDNLVYRNWFAVQFGDLYFHFSLQGEVRVYRYGSDTTVTPTLIESFEIASYADIVGQDGYFIFLPIPGYGIALYHTHNAQTFGTQTSSANALAKRGHLVKIVRRDESLRYSVHDGGKVRIAINGALTVIGFKFAYHSIRYEMGAGHTFLGEVFDPQFKPASTPSEIDRIEVPTLRAGASTIAYGELLKPDASGLWTAGVDRQGRVRLTLQTGNPIYSPVVAGTFVRWLPILLPRTTTPVIVDYDTLEFTETDTGQVEGQVVFSAKEDDLAVIVERGDTTWQIERCDNPTVPEASRVWVIVAGGLAIIADDVIVYCEDDGRIRYLAKFGLYGMERRFDEVTQTMDTSFEGYPIGIAINTVLSACGFNPISPLPAGSLALTLPDVPSGQHWRFAPRRGDRGDKIIKQLLLMLRQQWVEWRLRYDWEAGGWILEQKPRDTSEAQTWTFTGDPTEANLALRKVLIAVGDELYKFRVFPPEGNHVQAYGMTDASNNGKRVPGTPLVNQASKTDPTSPDYLGRVKVISPLFAPLSDVHEVNKMGRRVYDAACHRDLQVPCVGGDYVKELAPGKRVLIPTKRPSGAIGLIDGWLKRRTTEIDRDCHIKCTYLVSTQWEGALSD